MLKYFLTYLIKSKILTKANIEVALRLQLHFDRRIGNLGVFTRMISPSDVLKIVAAQTKSKDDRPFGEVAIAEGLSKPGDHVDLRAEMDVLVVISNCPERDNPAAGF